MRSLGIYRREIVQSPGSRGDKRFLFESSWLFRGSRSRGQTICRSQRGQRWRVWVVRQRLGRSFLLGGCIIEIVLECFCLSCDEIEAIKEGVCQICEGGGCEQSEGVGLLFGEGEGVTKLNWALPIISHLSYKYIIWHHINALIRHHINAIFILEQMDPQTQNEHHQSISHCKTIFINTSLTPIHIINRFINLSYTNQQNTINSSSFHHCHSFSNQIIMHMDHQAWCCFNLLMAQPE